MSLCATYKMVYKPVHTYMCLNVVKLNYRLCIQLHFILVLFFLKRANLFKGSQLIAIADLMNIPFN